MTKLKSVILMMLVGVLMLGLVGCGGTKTKPTNATVQDIQELKNTIIDGSLTNDEKKKVVELTQKYAQIGINTDYTKDTLDTVKEIFKYTTPDVAKDYPDELLTKVWNGQKATKQIIKIEGTTFNKVSKSADGNITVDFSVKEHVISHTNEAYNGKTFDAVECKFVFNKDWQISAFAIGDLK